MIMMGATSTSEMSVNFYQTTRRNNPEDSHLHTRRRENPKSHLKELLPIILDVPVSSQALWPSAAFSVI
jgi:hypothetical protein